MRTPVINAALFVVGVIACLIGGPGLWLAGALVAVHVFWLSSWRAEGKLLISVMLLGCALDSFALHIGLFDYGKLQRLAPVEHALLWLLLATTLNHCLAFTAQPAWRASLAGTLIAPAFYGALHQFNGLHSSLATGLMLMVMSALWALLWPLLHGFARLYREQYRQYLAQLRQ